MIEKGNFALHYYDKAIDLLKRLAVIPAPSLKEDKRVDFIISYLKAEGIKDAYVDEAKNVIIPYNDDGKRDLDVFAAHTDVVFNTDDFLRLEIDGDTLYCPGSGDDSAHVVAVVLYALYFHREKINTRRGILFVLNSAEEGLGNLKGVKTLFAHYKERIKSFTSFDASLGQGIVTEAVGSERYLIKVKTKGGHSYKDFGEESAIAESAKVISALYSQRVKDATYNVGTIKGGTSVNSIAESAEFTYEYRSTKSTELKKMRSVFFSTIESFSNEKVKIDVEKIGVRPCGEKTDIRELRSKAESALKRYNYSTEATSSSTDCNWPLSLKTPSICFGLAEIHNSHTLEEHISLSSYKKGLDIGYDYIISLTASFH